MLSPLSWLSCPFGRSPCTHVPSLHRHYPASSVVRTRPPPQAARSGPHGPPVAGRTRTTWGFPCCVGSPCTDMPSPNTPVGPLVHIASRGYAPQFPSDGGLPRFRGGSAPTLRLSRPARRSLHVTACLLAESPWRPFASKASAVSLPPPPLRLLPAGATKLPGG